MSGKDNGGPAFPPNAGWRDNDHECRGLTVRDYFAAKAMQSLVAMSDGYTHRQDQIKPMCADAYAWADAMLAERDQ